jgi:hypothetical protein
MNKKLKLTKLTIANLERIKGGELPCVCHFTVGDGAFNRDNPTISCKVCPITGAECEI